MLSSAFFRKIGENYAASKRTIMQKIMLYTIFIQISAQPQISAHLE